MNCIHEEARQRGISELTSNVSKAAEVFFLRHGFHIVERGFPICRGVTLQNAPDEEMFGEIIVSLQKGSIVLLPC